jgi:hypothetical protein
MPSGDAVRAWFPQMHEELKMRWTPSLAWDECAQLCREMTILRAKIRKKQGIKSPQMICKGCGGVHGMEPLPIGIRSLLFTLRKLSLLDDEQFKKLDAEWKKHQRHHRLDSLGDPKKKQNKSCEATGDNVAS